MTVNRFILGVLWLTLVIFAFGFAPPRDPQTLDLIKNLSIGQWQGINPIIIALFNLMGVWPMVYGAMLLGDRQGKKIPAWPFVAGSFFLGAFAILPYLVLRQDPSDFTKPESFDKPTGLTKFWHSPWLGRVLFLLAIACGSGAIFMGDWGDYLQQLKTNQFIAVMSSDFLCLTLTFPFVLAQDLRRRQIFRPLIFWLISAVPLFGPMVYLSVRPPLTSEKPLSFTKEVV